MQTLRAGALYFAVVFAAGFALGAIRLLLIAPRIGERAAELIETPFMLAVAYCAARWVIHRSLAPPSAGTRFAIGSIALALTLAAEFGIALPLRGLTLEQYFAAQDPISGVAYYLALVAFALFPLFVPCTSPR